MISFQNDYNDIAHPLVLERLFALKEGFYGSYGNDVWTKQAVKLLQHFLQATCDIHFVHGGTMANILALTSILRPYEAIIAPKSAHIYAHETGAMELRGHRIIPVDCQDGRLRKKELEKTLSFYGEEYNVIPKIVCISNTTEFGEVYSKKMLEELYEVCQKHNLYFYIDGARLGSAMNSDQCDYRWEDLPHLCDALSIGGTKNGALFGEALVFFHSAFSDHFRFYLKSQGAMMAKGFLIALQFIVLFENGLYQENASLANHAVNELVAKLAFNRKVIFPNTPSSNQIFFYHEEALEKRLKGKVSYEVTRWYDGKKVIRLVTTYRTTNQEIEELAVLLNGESKE